MHPKREYPNEHPQNEVNAQGGFCCHGNACNTKGKRSNKSKTTMADPDMIAKMMELYLARYASANEKTIRQLVLFYMSVRYNYDGRVKKVFDNTFEPESLVSTKSHRNMTVITHSKKKFLQEWAGANFAAPITTTLGASSSAQVYNVAQIFCTE